MIRICPIFACPDNSPKVVELLNSCDWVYAKDLRTYRRATAMLDKKVQILMLPECYKLKKEDIAKLHSTTEFEVVDVSDIYDAMKG